MRETTTTVTQKPKEYSLKCLLFTNFCSLMSGLCIHYLIDHHRF